MSKFDELARILFDGEVAAADFKIMPGADSDLDRDQLAESILESMDRMGLVKSGSLVSPVR